MLRCAVDVRSDNDVPRGPSCIVVKLGHATVTAPSLPPLGPVTLRISVCQLCAFRFNLPEHWSSITGDGQAISISWAFSLRFFSV